MHNKAVCYKELIEVGRYFYKYITDQQKIPGLEMGFNHYLDQYVWSLQVRSLLKIQDIFLNFLTSLTKLSEKTVCIIYSDF